MNQYQFKNACSELENAIVQYDSEMDEFDFAFVHGLLVANTISIHQEGHQKLLQCIFDQDDPFTDKGLKQWAPLIDNEIKAIDRLLQEEGGGADLFPLHREKFALWCSGFIELHFLQEELWLKNREQEVSELLLPIMMFSGLFLEEAEFKAMSNDQQLLEDMKEQLPDVLTELYLLFRE